MTPEEASHEMHRGAWRYPDGPKYLRYQALIWPDAHNCLDGKPRLTEVQFEELRVLAQEYHALTLVLHPPGDPEHEAFVRGHERWLAASRTFLPPAEGHSRDE